MRIQLNAELKKAHNNKGNVAGANNNNVSTYKAP